jgi:hypothetical protein
MAAFMERGRMTFEDIRELAQLDYRRVYDIMNVLQTTPLISKEGRKRDADKPFLFGDGTPLGTGLPPLHELLVSIEAEQRAVLVCAQRLWAAQQLAPPPGEDGAPLPVLEAEYVRYVDALVRSAAADQR